MNPKNSKYINFSFQVLIISLNDVINGIDKNNHNSSFENPSNLDKAAKAIQEAIEWIEEEGKGAI